MKHSMSERTFYRRRNQAIQALAASLYEILLPPLRAEQPPVRPLAGRAAILRAGHDALHAGQSVYLSGPSGIGKTALAARIAGQWPGGCFWFTLRAQWTDRLASFVFALAFYLRSQGASATWRQLIADNGLVQIDRTLSLLRYDLTWFETAPLLLCIDDVDALAAERADHAQLLHLLDELRTRARLLLTGQRVVLETDAHFALAGFDDQELAAWLALGEIRDIGAEQRARLRHTTRGHPALLGLLATLHAYGEDLLAAAASIPDVPSLEVLLARVWRRLDEAERHVLMGVAVYRTAAPQDDWRDVAAVMERLLARGLLQSDGRGGIECDPHLRRLVYVRITPEARRVLHLRAVYHYLEAHQPAQAVWLWFRHRKQQVERGQGPAALALLDQIAPGDLPHAADQAALSLARAELLKLVGRPEAVQDALRQVMIYQKLSYLHTTRLPNLGAAQQEAWQALFYAETSAANVDELQGDLVSARARYTRALEVAARMEHGAELLAVGYSHLGKCLLKLGDLEAAVTLIQQALALSEAQGDLLGPLYDRINLAYALMVQGRTADAWTLAADGLAVAERMQLAI